MKFKLIIAKKESNCMDFLDVFIQSNHHEEVFEDFMNAVKQFKFNFIIGTNSQYLVNFIGGCIAEGVLKFNDVECELHDEEIKEIMFSDGGYLINFPFGWFEGNEKYYEILKKQINE